MLRRWAATERQMRYAARGADRLHVKALFEFLDPVPQTFAASKDHRHDHDVQVVDEIRGEEQADGRRSSADADVKATGCIPGRLKGCIWGGVNEVECRATGHLDRGTGVMGQYEHRGVEGRVVSPPAPLHSSSTHGPRWGPNLFRPMISVPMPGAHWLARALSTPVLPPGSPCISRKVFVGKNHW